MVLRSREVPLEAETYTRAGWGPGARKLINEQHTAVLALGEGLFVSCSAKLLFRR